SCWNIPDEREVRRSIIMLTFNPSVSQAVQIIVSGGGPPPTGFVYILVAMENQDYSSVIGNSSAPFINSLVRQGATIPNYHGGFGGNSEPNYVAMVAGSFFGD